MALWAQSQHRSCYIKSADELANTDRLSWSALIKLIWPMRRVNIMGPMRFLAFVNACNSVSKRWKTVAGNFFSFPRGSKTGAYTLFNKEDFAIGSSLQLWPCWTFVSTVCKDILKMLSSWLEVAGQFYAPVLLTPVFYSYLAKITPDWSFLGGRWKYYGLVLPLVAIVSVSLLCLRQSVTCIWKTCHTVQTTTSISDFKEP